ncbi:MAG: hypothetical protein WAU45_18865 [Blastocatellia bacterium]
MNIENRTVITGFAQQTHTVEYSPAQLMLGFSQLSGRITGTDREESVRSTVILLASSITAWSIDNTPLLVTEAEIGKLPDNLIGFIFSEISQDTARFMEQFAANFNILLKGDPDGG